MATSSWYAEKRRKLHTYARTAAGDESAREVRVHKQNLSTYNTVEDYRGKYDVRCSTPEEYLSVLKNATRRNDNFMRDFVARDLERYGIS